MHALRGTAMDNPLPGDVAHGEAVFWGKGRLRRLPHRGRPRQHRRARTFTNIASVRKATAINDALTKAQHRVYGDGGVHLPMMPLHGLHRPCMW